VRVDADDEPMNSIDLSALLRPALEVADLSLTGLIARFEPIDWDFGYDSEIYA
jgi:hypothetical protein